MLLFKLIMKYNLLIVDDCRVTRSLIKHMLNNEGDKYNIFMAENGKVAYEMAIENPPDLILMDWEMPVMDGIETLKHLKTTDATRDVPVIMITAFKNLEEAFEAGATDYIHKPIDKTELLVRVKSTLSLFRLLTGIIKQAEQLEIQSYELELQKRRVEAEKKKSDELLQNILPYEVAEQLKNKGTVEAKKYKLVSVLFTDFKGFTKLSEQLTTEEIVNELDICFEKFEEIIGNHYIEKIKTIGDAFMCAGGLPIRNKSNPIDMVLTGLQIQKFMNEYNAEKRKAGHPEWGLRCGVHTGSVIAGVIGKKKFAYDIWGDTVNTAARMETAGDVGKVNISGATYKYVKDLFDCTYRGKIEAKNKGEIDMYFVNGLLPEYQQDGDTSLPNSKFLEILSTI